MVCNVLTTYVQLAWAMGRDEVAVVQSNGVSLEEDERPRKSRTVAAVTVGVDVVRSR